MERRARRSGLRDLLNKLDFQKRQKEQSSKSKIAKLKDDVKLRDREIYELQNATIIIDTERIWDLEQQVDDLKKELRTREKDQREETRYDWTMAARDPFANSYTNLDIDMEDNHFGDATAAQLTCGTPSRGARSSFPTPPATSPTIPTAPNTPCRLDFFGPRPTHVGVQADFVDTEKQRAEEEVVSLQLEVDKLTSTLYRYKSLAEQLTERITSKSVVSLDSGVGSDTVVVLEAQVENLLRTVSDRAAAISELSSSISDLGFPGSDASDMIQSLTTGFRAARLELEYLTPGEIDLPLSSHGAEVLDLLLTRLRELASKSKDDEASIDEYHSIEQSLRKQLDSRVSVMDTLKQEMQKAEGLLKQKTDEASSLQIGNDRLKGAVDSYLRDISELEALVERMEREGQDSTQVFNTTTESHQAALLAKTTTITTLETKLSTALSRNAELQTEISQLQDSQTRHVVKMNKQHGKGLALRDARVAELREEIDRINASLRAAHEMIRKLRVEKGGLEKIVEEEKGKAAEETERAKEEVERIKGEMEKMVRMNREARAGGSIAEKNECPLKRNADTDELATGEGAVVVVKGHYLAGDLARRTSSRLKRRRYDSGLGFMDEDEDEVDLV